MNWQPIPTVTAPRYQDNTFNPVQSLVNAYLEKVAGGFVVCSLPGFATISNAPNGQPCRGAAYDASLGEYYTVHGNTVYRVYDDGSFTAMTGTLLTSSGNVVLAVGPSQTLIVDGQYGYTISSLVLTQITDLNFPANPVSCACFNAQFIVATSPGDRWYMSAVEDGLTWTPVISGRTLYTADSLKHVESVRDVVYFFSERSIEIWYPSSIDPYLQPVTGSAQPIGLSHPESVALFNGSLYFFGRGESRGSIYRLSGSELTNITPPYIQNLIGEWGDLGVYGVAYSNMGQDFYEVHNVAGGTAPDWIYNITSDTWSQSNPFRTFRKVFNTPNGKVMAFSYDAEGCINLGTSTVRRNTLDGSDFSRTLDFVVDGGMSRIFNSGLRFEFEIQHDNESAFTFSALLQKSDDGGLTFDAGITISKAVTNGTSAQQVTLGTPPLGSAKAGRIYRLSLIGAFRFILRRAEGLVSVGRF